MGFLGAYDKLYVSGFETVQSKFKEANAGELKDALVVSCNDWSEIGKLPQQVSVTGAKHFMLAMQDVSGEVDDIEHVVDALQAISLNYDRGLPTYIHCSQGVGRSVMVAYAFIAYLYLRNDSTIKPAIDKLTNKSLDPNSNYFIKHLSTAAYKFVYEKRPCSQFDDKLNICIKALSLIHQRIKKSLPITKVRNNREAFLCNLVQSQVFKKIITHHYFTGPYIERPNSGIELLDGILADDLNWELKLKKLIQSTEKNEIKTLLTELQNVVNKIRATYPPPAAARTKEKIKEFRAKVVEEITLEEIIDMGPDAWELQRYMLTYGGKNLDDFKEHMSSFKLIVNCSASKPVIIDLGCGHVLHHFFKMFQYFEDFIYIGVDVEQPSPMVAALKEMYPEDFHYIHKTLYDSDGIKNEVSKILGPDKAAADLVLIEELYVPNDLVLRKLYEATIGTLVPKILKDQGHLHIYPTHTAMQKVTREVLETHAEEYQTISDPGNDNFNITHRGQELTDEQSHTLSITQL